MTKKDAICIVKEYVHHYNHVRLHSAIGYISPEVKLDGREGVVFDERDRKLETARKKRAEKRRGARETVLY